MEVLEAMRTIGACRYYKPDPVPYEVLHAAFDAARFGPQGGNRQPVRWIVVRDPAKKRALRDIYLPTWKAHLAQALEATSGDHRAAGGTPMLRAADHFAEHMDEIPVLVVVCAALDDLWVADKDLDRVSIVGGASIYPTVQNFSLACRDQGVATTFTTIHAAHEPEVKQLLEIPGGYAVGAMVAAGYPEKGFPRKLKRAPVEETTFGETFGAPFRPVDAD